MNKKNHYHIISFTISIFMMLAVYACCGIWPLGDKTVATGDLSGIYINFFSHFSNALKQGEFSGLIYGFDKSLGGSLIGALAYHCISPFNIIYLFFNTENYYVAATIIHALKISVSSATMNYYLINRFSRLNLISVLLSLCYGFCSYNIVYSQNTMWQDTVVLLPLVALGIYYICNYRKPYLYVIALTFAIITNFYTGYMVCIFSVQLFFAELILNNNNIKQFFKPVKDFFISSLYAGGLSAFMLIPTLADMKMNKGINSGITFTGDVAFKFNEFFYRLFPFNFTWSNVENGLPNVYTGTVCIAFLALFFAGKKITVKEKVTVFTLLAFLFLSMYSFDFMVFYHGLATPNWFPYRNSFIFSFLMCYISAYARSKAELDIKRIVIAAIFIFVLIMQAFFIRNIWFTVTLLFTGTVFLGINSVLLVGMKIKPDGLLKICTVLLLAITGVELVLNSAYCLNQFENFGHKEFDDMVKGVQSQLDQISEEGVYTQRIEKNFWRTYNDTTLFGYPGLSYFTSTQDSVNTSMLGWLGYASVNCYEPYATAFAESYLGIGHIICREDKHLRPHLTAHITDEKYFTRENPYVFPMVYAIADSAKDFAFNEEENAIENQNRLFSTLGGEGRLFVPREVNITYNEMTGIGMEIDCQQDGLLYIILESEKNEPVYMYFQGTSTYYVYESTLDLCSVEQGDIISAEIVSATGVHSITDIKAYILDTSALMSLSDKLWQSAGNTDISANKFKSYIVCDSDDMLYLINAPYSDFSRVYVDGQEVESEYIHRGLTGVRINKGEHIIEVKGVIRGLKTGIAISGISLLSIAAYYIIIKNSKKR